MIQIIDNYFDEKSFQTIKEYCKKDFKIIKLGEKEFSVLETPDIIIPALQINGFKLITTFIRSAYKGFDNEHRIHADNVIEGYKTDLASVFYISGDEVCDNGTAFFKHHKYGRELPKDVTNQEFDRLIKEDSNDMSKWEMQDFVKGIPNRMVMYSSNIFHSKFPDEIDRGVRKVMVNFYSKI